MAFINGRGVQPEMVPDQDTGLLTFPELQHFSHLLCAFTGRHAHGITGERDFNMDPDRGGKDAGNALENRGVLAQMLGIRLEDTVWFDPDDSGDVKWVGAEAIGRGGADWSTRISGCSGIVAQCTNIVLATTVSDNATVALFDPRMLSLGLVSLSKAHPWGGSVEQAINMMIERGNAQAKEIIGLIAPSVGPCCYTYEDPNLSMAGGRSNLWDSARAAMVRAKLSRKHIQNVRICTACRDTKYFTRTVDGPDGGAGAILVGVIDEDGSLARTLTARKARARLEEERAALREQGGEDAISLSEEQRRLNKKVRCPFGIKKVYIRSVLTGTMQTTKPAIFLRCAALAATHTTVKGDKVVDKDHVLAYCADKYPACEAYKTFMALRRRRV